MSGANAVGPNTPARPTKVTRPGWFWPAIVGAAVVSFLATFLVVRAVVDRGAEGAAAEDVVDIRLLPVDEPDEDPFVTSVGTAADGIDTTAAREAGMRLDLPATDPSDDLVDVRTVRPTDGSGPLYAKADAACDVDAIADALEGDDGARAAWTSLMDVEDGAVRETLDGLIPLVLTRDTAVTNSVYSGGEPGRFQAVLEAGTPVLVDGSGVPKVKCSCANPLDAPEVGAKARFEGDRWEGFDEDEIVSVSPVEPGTTRIPVVDLGTGDDDVVELGGVVPTATLDGMLVDDSTGVYVQAHDGTRTLVLDEPVANVFDDGAGGLVFQPARDGDTLLERRNTLWAQPEDARRAGIWRLRAGEAEPELLVAGDGWPDRWYSLQDVDGPADRRRMGYLEVGDERCEGVGDAEVCSFDITKAHLLDLDTGKSRVLDGLERPGELRIGEDVAAVGWTTNDHWGLVAQRLDGTVRMACLECGLGLEDLLDDDTYLNLTSYRGYTLDICAFTDALVETCDRSYLLSHSEPGAGERATAVVDGTDVIVSVQNADGSVAAGYVVDTTVADDSAIEVVDIGGRTRPLSAPLVRPVNPMTGADPTPGDGGEQSSPSATWEQVASAEIPALCRHEPSVLVEGVDRNIDPDMGDFRLLRTLLDSGAPALLADVPSDVGPLTAVVAMCSAGGVPWPNPVLFFDADGIYVASTFLNEASAVDDEADSSSDWSAAWEQAGLQYVGRDGIRAMRLEGDVVAFDVVALVDGDAECCPSATATVSVRVSGGRVELVSVEAT
ncbi:MAG: hypothetical protein KF906_01845 [Actinobacteria bacterium]|nr:hypothetical protein [Actinomycetota bacterium]